MASLTQINFESDSEDDPDFTPDAGADSDNGLLIRLSQPLPRRLLIISGDSSSQASAPSAKRTKLEEDRSTSEVKVTEEESVILLLCEGST